MAPIRSASDEVEKAPAHRDVVSVPPERANVPDFCADRRGLIPPLPWPTFSPPSSDDYGTQQDDRVARPFIQSQQKGCGLLGFPPLPGATVPRIVAGMAEQWIAAAAAREVVGTVLGFNGATRALCLRAHSGLVDSKAKLLEFGDRRASDAPIPAAFWRAKGETALKQNWATGDFSTWLDRTTECRAFGASFALGGDLLPVLSSVRS